MGCGSDAIDQIYLESKVSDKIMIKHVAGNFFGYSWEIEKIDDKGLKGSKMKLEIAAIND